jgi:hypothetical protein
MSWYIPLLDKFMQHLIDKHGHNTDPYVLQDEYNMQEEYLLYEKFKHGGLEYQCCPFVGCNWRHKFTVNYDLLIESDEK